MSYLEEASELLARVKGRPLRLQERKVAAIELAALMLNEATRSMTPQEKAIQKQLSRLMQDPNGKAFTTAMTDQCFRSQTNKRIADQMIYLLHQIGAPRYLSWWKRAELLMLKTLNPSIAQFLIPFAARALRKETSRVILPGEFHFLNQ